MRGTGLALLLGAALAAAQEGPREFQVRPLGFSVAVPAGWATDQAASGLVARDPMQNGFMVTREPFLHDPEKFADAWQAYLSAARIDAKVERAKAAGRDAWRATWATGDRQIEVWRLYVPECEMLYNFSFSGGPGFDLKALVDPTLKSFRCTAAKPELKFQKTAESVTTRISLRLPEGYEKEPREMGFQLGGGISGGFVKTLPGYDPPHIAGRIRFRGIDAQMGIPTPDGQWVLASDTEKVLDYLWREDEKEFGVVAKKPKARDSTFSGVKGSAMEASVVAKSGMPQVWMAFAGKLKQDVVCVVVLVDEREARLCKDYLRQVCSNLVVAK